MKKILAAVILGIFAIALTVPGIANAGKPPNPNCWGTVTHQLASSEVGVVGDHASDPTPPPEPLGRPGRGGLGNSPFGHPSNLGSFLATIDGVDETECPLT